jgi:lathosterol oxidase
MHRLLYLGMFLFVNVWTVMIHDGEYLTKSPLVNGAANHTIHHILFNYNYGQYFTIWDRIGGSYRKPTNEQYDRQLKNSREVRMRESASVEQIMEKDPELMRDYSVEYLGVKSKEE